MDRWISGPKAVIAYAIGNIGGDIPDNLNSNLSGTGGPPRRRRAVNNQPSPSPGPNSPQSNSVETQVRNIINSLVNPVLSVGYNVNATRAIVLQEKVVKATVEILQRPKSPVTTSSPNNPKTKLQTYSHPTYQDQAGVYVVRNVETGNVIVGQSSNIQNRGEQYLNRGNALLSGKAPFAISTAFTNDVLALQGTGKDVRQVFECLFVAHWPKVAATATLTSGVSLTDQQEMNYVEALLTYVFQNLGFSLNTVIVPSTNTTSLPQAMTTLLTQML